MQWPKYTKGITRSRISKTESIQWPTDTKGITRSCISKEDSQYNGQKIPKAYPEAVYQRRTVNAMAK